MVNVASAFYKSVITSAQMNNREIKVAQFLRKQVKVIEFCYVKGISKTNFSGNLFYLVVVKY